MAKYVDVSGCEFLQIGFEFFHETHKCLMYSDEDTKMECEECGTCLFKQLQLMKSENEKLKHKLEKLKKVK